MSVVFRRVMAMLAAGLALAACSTTQPTVQQRPANRSARSGFVPFNGVPAYLMRPNGLMLNGLVPTNPNDQS